MPDRSTTDLIPTLIASILLSTHYRNDRTSGYFVFFNRFSLSLQPMPTIALSVNAFAFVDAVTKWTFPQFILPRSLREPNRTPRSMAPSKGILLQEGNCGKYSARLCRFYSEFYFPPVHLRAMIFP
jgi:hypothetical protein